MSEAAAKDRMIAAAVALFARGGFNGVTTRDIASSANVSEGNLFRYFRSKRELFIAAIDYELGKLRGHVRLLDGASPQPARSGLSLQHANRRAGDLGPAGDAGAENSRVALRSLFEVITETVVQEPALVRLLHFSVLEFGPEMGPLFRKHLDSILADSARNFERWSQNYGLRNLSAQVTVLSFVATVVLLQMYPVVSGAELPFTSVESAAAAYAELWYRVLTDGGGELSTRNPAG
jgi:AcrR family transcriptional regulator